MPVGGDDSEVILMQSGFGAVGLLGSKGVVRNGREGGSGGSSSRRRWQQCPGTVCQRRRASSPRPALVGSRLQGWGRPGACMDSDTESSRDQVRGLLVGPWARPPLRGAWVL